MASRKFWIFLPISLFFFSPAVHTAVSAQTPSVIFNGNNTHNGTETFTGPIQCKQLLTVACVDGSAYPQTSAGILQAITDLLARSSNGGEVWVIPGTYSISATILNTANNVTLKCLGGPGGAFYGSGGAPPDPVTQPGSCILNWTGSAGGTIASWNAPSSATQSIAGGGVIGFDFEGNSSASVGLHVANVWYGDFANNFFDEFTSQGLLVNSDPTITNGAATQFNTFKNLSFKEVVSSGNCILVSGDANEEADSAFNTFIGIRAAAFKNGDCILINDADNDRWYNVGLSRVSGGTGIGVHLSTVGGYTPSTCPFGGGSAFNCSAREESFFGLDPSTGGVVQDQYAASNEIYGYQTGNGAHTPSVSTTAGSLLYTESGPSSGDVYYGLIQTASTNPALQIFSTNVAAPNFNSYILWGDSSGGKWDIGRFNSTNDFALNDLVSSINRLYMPGGTNSATEVNASGTASVLFNAGAHAGTGGVQFYSGGATPSQMASISSAGNAIFNGTLSVGGGSTVHAIYTASALVLNSSFTSITAGTCQDQTLTLTGAATTGTASVSPTAALGNGFSWSARVSASNTITVHVCSGTTGIPTSVTWNTVVVQ